MRKRNTLIISLASACALLILAITAGGAYYLGMQQEAQKVQLMQTEQAVRAADYAKSLQSVQTERNRALNDYQAACYEYQKLRSSYEELFEKKGADSGLPKYTSPDDARGNEESCYR